MNTDLAREVRFLKRYAICATLAFGGLLLTAFRQEKRATFDVIDVQRINIVEPNGNYRMILSNAPRSAGPIYKGKAFGYPGGGRPGIIFFNDEGTENGGLTFTGQRKPDGTFESSVHMSFDQFDQDQVLTLDYADNNGRRRVGMSILDRAYVNIHDLVRDRDSIQLIRDSSARAQAMARLLGPRDGVPLAARRVFVGRDVAKSAILNLSDPEGRSRLRLLVDSTGASRIEFLDAEGKVVRSIP